MPRLVVGLVLKVMQYFIVTSTGIKMMRTVTVSDCLMRYHEVSGSPKAIVFCTRRLEY